MALVIPMRQVVLPLASTSEGCGNSALKMEPEGKVLDVVSAATSATGEGTGGRGGLVIEQGMHVSNEILQNQALRKNQ